MKWREGLSRTETSDSTLMLFPGAGHGLRMGEHHAGGERPANEVDAPRL